MGSIMSLLADGQDTQGRFALMEFRTKPGNEPPPHVHAWEAEMYYVLEGEMQFYCEEDVFRVRAGEVVFLPQGKPHAFYVRSPFARTLLLALATGEHAVGLDRYFAGMAEPTSSMELPSDEVAPALHDPRHTIGAAAVNGIRILSAEETIDLLPRYPGFEVDPDVLGEFEKHPSFSSGT
jgi:quercetin dioxygenase-like cupin family protein